MAQSVKLKDGSYIDATGVYDTTQRKTQSDVNSEVSSSISTLQTQASKYDVYNIEKVKFYYYIANISLILFLANEDRIAVDFYLDSKKIQLSKYDHTTEKYTIIWAITS